VDIRIKIRKWYICKNYDQKDNKIIEERARLQRQINVVEELKCSQKYISHLLNNYIKKRIEIKKLRIIKMNTFGKSINYFEKNDKFVLNDY